MALRSPHGRAAELGSGPRVEVMPADELPRGVPAEQPPSSGPERGPDGRFLPGNKRAASKGGKASRYRTGLADRMALGRLVERIGDASEWRPYLEEAEAFQRAQMRYLSDEIGGGILGPDVASIVITAAWQTAASRFAQTKAMAEGDTSLLALASRLGNDARQNLLAARELAARAAQARADEDDAILIPPRTEP